MTMTSAMRLRRTEAAEVREWKPNTFPRGSSDWWLEHLGRKLAARQSRMASYQRYYDGDHPLLFATEKFREAFGGLFGEFSDNFMAVIVDVLVERCVIQGLRLDKPDGDEEAWRIWQANGLDVRIRTAFREAFVKGECSILVSPFEWDFIAPNTPRITIEDPHQMVVELDPADPRRRLAALKVWQDEGMWHATLYLPDRIEKYKWDNADSLWSRVQNLFGMGGLPRWVKRQPAGEAWPIVNPIGVVPVVPLVNKPNIRGEGESELRAVIPLQNAINKETLDMMVASEFAAFPQRYIIGVEDDEDPEDPGVGRSAAQRFELGVSRLLLLPAAEEGGQHVTAGEFRPADLTPYVKAVEMFIQHAATKSRMPVHIFLGGAGSFPSGESLNAAEAGLVAKAKDKQLDFSDPIEEAWRIAFLVIGDRARAAVMASEVIWLDPAFRSPSEWIDALGKEHALLDIPVEFLWEKAGYSPQQIERIRTIRLRNQLEALPAAPPPLQLSGPGLSQPPAVTDGTS